MSHLQKFIQIRREPESPADPREFHLRFEAQLYDLAHATTFSIAISSHNSLHVQKVCAAINANRALTRVSLQSCMQSNFHPVPQLNDDAFEILKTLAHSSVTSVEVGYQLNSTACEVLKTSTISEIVLRNPDLNTLGLVPHFISTLTSFGIAGTGLQSDGPFTRAALQACVEQIAAAPLQQFMLDGAGMKTRWGAFNELKFYYAVLTQTQSIQHLVLNFADRRTDPELEALAAHLRTNTSLKSLTVLDYHEDHQNTGDAIALLKDATPPVRRFNFCGETIV